MATTIDNEDSNTEFVFLYIIDIVATTYKESDSIENKKDDKNIKYLLFITDFPCNPKQTIISKI